MSVIRITGNTQIINSTANVIALANTYGANATAGATCVYIFNNGASNTVLTLANSQGSFTFNLAVNTFIILQKNATDTLAASVNCIANPIAKVPS